MRLDIGRRMRLLEEREGWEGACGVLEKCVGGQDFKWCLCLVRLLVRLTQSTANTCR